MVRWDAVLFIIQITCANMNTDLHLRQHVRCFPSLVMTRSPCWPEISLCCIIQPWNPL